MKRVCLFLLLSISVCGYSQIPDSQNKKGLKPKLIHDARMAEKIIQFRDSVAKDSNHPKTIEPQIRDEGSRNIDGILQWQKEQRAKQKRNAMIRIGIGIFFLIVLVIGLSRKRKNRIN